MLSVFRVGATATRHPCSPLYKAAAFTLVLGDASNAPPEPVALFPLKGDIDLPRSLPVPDISSDTVDEHPDTCSAPMQNDFSSCFPVHGPFHLLYCIQNGTFGSAWAASDQKTGRLLCLKVFQGLQDPTISSSVKAELRIFRRMVKSKGGEMGKRFIIELNRSIHHGNDVFFAMELMTTDLAMYLASDPQRCEMNARRWMAQMALGIQSLHDMGILHRDIKSENILIDPRENIRIVDFGLSYLSHSGAALCRGVEYAINFLGTPPYMAPEIMGNKGLPAHSRRGYGTAVDWWALGCILYELESRDHQVLFDTEEDVHAYIAWHQCTTQPGKLHPAFDGLDPVVVNLLEGLVHIQPHARYSLIEMEKHDYFLLADGTCEFDNATARALDRSVRPELVPPFSCDDEPMKIIQAARLSSVYDWTNLKWARRGVGENNGRHAMTAFHSPTDDR